MAGRLPTVRSCSAPSPIGATNYENQRRAVDLGTTLRVAPRVHSPNNNKPERNENCVTHVVGLKCYLCHRLLRVPCVPPLTAAPAAYRRRRLRPCRAPARG